MKFLALIYLTFYRYYKRIISFDIPLGTCMRQTSLSTIVCEMRKQHIKKTESIFLLITSAPFPALIPKEDQHDKYVFSSKSQEDKTPSSRNVRYPNSANAHFCTLVVKKMHPVIKAN